MAFVRETSCQPAAGVQTQQRKRSERPSIWCWPSHLPLSRTAFIQRTEVSLKGLTETHREVITDGFISMLGTYTQPHQ